MGIYSQGAELGSRWIEKETSGIKGGFWSNWPNRILVKGRSGWSDAVWGMVEKRNLVRYPGWSDTESGRVCLTWLGRILAIFGLYKDRDRSLGLVRHRAQWSLSEDWSRRIIVTDNAKLFTKAVVPIYFSTSRVWDFQLVYTLIKTWYQLWFWIFLEYSGISWWF